MWRCQKCKSDNPDAAAFCQTCGEIKAAPGIAHATEFARSYARNTAPTSRDHEFKNKLNRQVENYLRVNATAGWLDFFGKVLIVLTIIATIVAFFVAAGTSDGFQFFLGLLWAIVIFLGGLIPGLLLKAVAAIWQNTDDTVSLLRYQIDVQNDREE